MTAKKAAPKSAVKSAQAKQVAKKAAKIPAPRRAAKAALSRKERLAALHPVAQSGLDSVTHDELNPAFVLKTK